MERFSIFCFSWNTNGSTFCEQDSPTCVAPNFFQPLADRISRYRPILFAISTQAEDVNSSYLHGRYLPMTLDKIGYKSLSSLSLNNDDGVLRLSVFCRQDKAAEFNHRGGFFHSLMFREKIKIKYDNDYHVGALCCRLSHKIIGPITLVAVDYPLTERNKREEVASPFSLEEYLAYRKKIFDINRAVSAKLTAKFGGAKQHLVMLGDFNSDIIIGREDPAIEIKRLTENVTEETLRDLQQYDELHLAKLDPSHPFYEFHEGRANEGPLFLPTWSLKKTNRVGLYTQTGKTEDSYERVGECSAGPNTLPATANKAVSRFCFGQDDTNHHLAIAWRDRILYHSSPELPFDLKLGCDVYFRVDVNHMQQSTHAGVGALLSFRR